MISVATGDGRGAHQVAWYLHTGVWPDKFVLHTCDNRKCCNPAHLFLGTQKENREDCKAKGRVARGPSHGMSKLSTAEVEEIRTLRAAGWNLKPLSAKFGVCESNISQICRGMTRAEG